MSPKTAASQVIIHRIEFQESEREILRDVALSFNFNRVMQPLVALINDNTTILLILSAIGAWIGLNYIPPLVEDTYEMVVDFQQQVEAALAQGTLIRERIGIVEGAVRRGPLWGTIDLAEAYFGINIPDFGGGYESSPASGGGGGF